MQCGLTTIDAARIELEVKLHAECGPPGIHFCKMTGYRLRGSGPWTAWQRRCDSIQTCVVCLGACSATTWSWAGPWKLQTAIEHVFPSDSIPGRCVQQSVCRVVVRSKFRMQAPAFLVLILAGMDGMDRTDGDLEEIRDMTSPRLHLH